MAVKSGLYNQLKDLGTLNWLEVIDKKLYTESLLLNKIPDCNFIEGETVTEEISNKRDGYFLKVVLDLDFLKAKMKKHICKYFNESQKEQYLKFCNDVWESYQNQELEDAINKLAMRTGLNKEDIMKLIQKAK